MKTLRVACVQLNAGSELEKNFSRIEKLLKEALKKHPHFIALPENFYGRTSSKALNDVADSVTPKALHYFKAFAAEHRVAMLLGSVLEKVRTSRKFYNTSVLISPQGEIIAKYRKIHLFDIGLKNVKVFESRHIARGRKIVVSRIHSVPAGLTICYDLRFPELFRTLTARGAKILLVPSNFTEETGKAHWEVLLRARAIENQAFVIAPAQTGIHPESGVRSYGNSLILDPWGRVLARASRTGEEIIAAELDFGFQARLRRSFPVLKHRVF
jgi:deaminated glutathione amidase